MRKCLFRVVYAVLILLVTLAIVLPQTSMYTLQAQSNQRLVTGGMRAANEEVVFGPTYDLSSVTVVTTGTWTATIKPAVSVNGSTWVDTTFMNPADGSSVASITSNGSYMVMRTPGFPYVRVYISAYTSGTVTARIQGSFAVAGSSAGGGSGGSTKILDGVGGVNTAQVNASSQLSVVCANCSGSGVSQVDNSGFTPGTSVFVPIGGEVDDTGTTAITENSAGVARLTVQRALHTNIRNNSGAELGITAAPFIVAGAGTAGAAAGGVVSIQGVGGGTTIPVTASAGTNLNTSALALESGGNLATLITPIRNEDSASADTHPGLVVNTVRQDAVSGLTSTDGDYQPFKSDAAGRLWVNATCSNCSGSGVSVLEDAASANADPGTPAYAVRQDTISNLTSTDGDYAPLKVNSVGRLYVDGSGVTLTAAGVAAADAVQSGNPLYAGARASTALPTAMSADGDAVGLWASLNGALNVILRQTDGTAVPLSTGGTGTIDANTGRITIATDDAVSVGIGKINTQMVAHDAADAGNPLKVGARATTSVGGLTLVANADRTDLMAGIDGVLITRPHSNLEDRVSGVAAVTDGSSTSLVAAQGSGVRFCATMIVISNSSATNVTVDIRDGTAGSVIMTLPAAANMGGAIVPLATPLCTSANTAMATDPSASATTVTTTAVGFKTKL